MHLDNFMRAKDSSFNGYEYFDIMKVSLVRGEYKFDRVNEFVKHCENTDRVFCRYLKGNCNAISCRNRLKKRLNSCDSIFISEKIFNIIKC